MSEVQQLEQLLLNFDLNHLFRKHIEMVKPIQYITD